MQGEFLVDLVNQSSQLGYDLYHSWQGTVLRWVLGGYTLLFIVNITIILVKYNRKLWEYNLYGNKTKKTFEKLKKKNPLAAWDEIKLNLDSPNAKDWKTALVEAEKMFDKELIKAGFRGEEIGERINQLGPSDLENVSLDELWDAHRIKNSVVNDSKFELTNQSARIAFEAFRKAAADLLAK
ncbi:MAG: hypothetical protein GF347_04710 [Candidatus Moranbacteria bacterium]|nr:hypothetical protein [Candidatus Moranbacteria bacterium]